MNINSNKIVLTAFFSALMVMYLFFPAHVEYTSPVLPVLENSEGGDNEVAERAEMNKARDEYYYNLLRDPVHDAIPQQIRREEVEHARSLPQASSFKRSKSVTYDYFEAGPDDVGGRTRALAVDLDNENIIIAGGVSGGIWKSVDAGATWTQKTRPDQNPSVSWLAQDPRPGFRNIWYYSTGEIRGNSARDRGARAFFYGEGIYKSTDNGESWFLLPSTDGGVDIEFDNPFDYVSKIVVSPATGSVFIGSNEFGIYRSDDQGDTWQKVLGDSGSRWNDIDVDSNGNLVAVLSTNGANFSNDINDFPGVYYSTDDGDTWSDVTPDVFPEDHDRSFVKIAPSNPDIAYVFTRELEFNEMGEFVTSYASLVKVDVSNPSASEYRTGNINNFGDPVGDLDTQGAYNMVLHVHPENEDLVLLGGTNLYRSFNGFSEKIGETNIDSVWIGGYANTNNISTYANHHPDNHVTFTHPNSPNKVYSGHDGGVSVTNNINSVPVQWTDLNNAYNVTQFYTVSIHPDAGDDRVAGGTQDNGSPFFRFSENGPTESVNISSGDGAYNFVGLYSVFTSSQRGRTFLIDYMEDGNIGSIFTGGNPPHQAVWKQITPAQASGQLFIHPFAVEPVGQGTIFYPSEDIILRNNSLGSIADFNPSPTSEGWEELTEVNLDGSTQHGITTLTVSYNNPRNRLYYGGSSRNAAPKLYRLDQANFVTDGEVDISIDEATVGSYLHDIAVNPQDGDEVIAIFSNYNIKGIFHSTDGGETWTAIEGNLEGPEVLVDNESVRTGPSIRTASILNTDEGNIYFVGTSTGLYSTTTPDGDNTIWTQEAPEVIGYNVVEFLDARPSDNTIAVGTHGRGIFIGKPGDAVSNENEIAKDIPGRFELKQNYPNPFNPTTNIAFDLPEAARVSLSIYTINGQKVFSLKENEITQAGSHNILLNASALSSGVYIYRITARTASRNRVFSDSGKMTLIK